MHKHTHIHIYVQTHTSRKKPTHSNIQHMQIFHTCIDIHISYGHIFINIHSHIYIYTYAHINTLKANTYRHTYSTPHAQRVQASTAISNHH